ncbi:hypothetical protein HYS91_03170 [Candidatus Daviesbacteria bacterium]|nr:hypothetical protein [Candidatus Daviesbacteria bacterium]
MFITKDPVSGLLTSAQTQNPYAYTLNNPINFSDPSGKIAPALILAFYTWATAVTSSPDLQQDIFFLSQDLNNCDPGGTAIDLVGLAIPGISLGTLKFTNKVVDAAKDLKIIIKHEHAAQHLAGTGLTADMVEAAIKGDLSQVGQLKPNEFIERTIQIGGQTWIYRAYGLSDGTISNIVIHLKGT